VTEKAREAHPLSTDHNTRKRKFERQTSAFDEETWRKHKTTKTNPSHYTFQLESDLNVIVGKRYHEEIYPAISSVLITAFTSLALA
jgi:hypothetical protein